MTSCVHCLSLKKIRRLTGRNLAQTSRALTWGATFFCILNDNKAYVSVLLAWEYKVEAVAFKYYEREINKINMTIKTCRNTVHFLKFICINTEILFNFNVYFQCDRTNSLYPSEPHPIWIDNGQPSQVYQI